MTKCFLWVSKAEKKLLVGIYITKKNLNVEIVSKVENCQPMKHYSEYFTVILNTRVMFWGMTVAYVLP